MKTENKLIKEDHKCKQDKRTVYQKLMDKIKK